MSGVDDKVQLHLIDTRQLVEEAQKIREVKKLAQDATKTKKDLAAGVSPLGGGTTPIGTPTGKKANKPKSFFESENQTSKGAVGGARTQNAFTQQQQQQKILEQKQRDLEKAQKEAEKKQADLEKELKQKQKDIEDNQKEFQQKLVGNLRNIQSIANPTGYASSIKYTVLGFLGKWGIIGSLVAGVISTAIDEISNQYTNSGGALSTILKVPKQALTVENIEAENAFNNGTKYITNDLRITQKSPQNSNTARLSAESVRYVVDNLGRTA